jgi:hypothetical protein
MSTHPRGLNVRYGWLFVLVLPAAGQVDAASILGRVTKAGGAPVVNGRVSAFNEWGWYVKDTSTDASGNYTLGPLAAGIYYVDARGEANNPCLVPVSFDGHSGSFNSFWSHASRASFRPLEWTAWTSPARTFSS